jgi:hypothetical protein
MSAVKSLRVRLWCVAALALSTTAKAGDEVSYYPSFYPQEIRIEPLDPATAAIEFVNKAHTLHAYVGTAANFGDEFPAFLKSVVSLRSLIAVSVNPKSTHAQGRDARCRAVSQAAQVLAKQPDVVPYRYPVTPYHADYLGHADLVAEIKAEAAGGAQISPLKLRTPWGTQMPLPQGSVDALNWDLDIVELPLGELLRQAGVGANIWQAQPWAKEGWFQAYHILRPGIGDAAQAERADSIYQRLTLGEFKDEVDRINYQRTLVATLSESCERAVIGYRLRRELYNDDFSNGIENIASDSQFGLNSPVFVRTIKLKDFPWNGWLRVGIDERATAAWNPIAGFTDTVGRLIWSAVGDDAFLPITYNSNWLRNRAEIVADDEARKPNHSTFVPADAFMPETGTGKLVAIGKGRGAMGKIIYRVSASPFQDGTEMDTADLLYPFALAYRWAEGERNKATFDPDIAATTQRLRDRLSGVRVLRVEQRVLQLADLTFTYHSPIVEVYLNRLSSDDEENALIAPPWSSVPWHVLALAEAAVERNFAAFSQTEAARRGVPWLDLVRDKAQQVKMAALIKEFAKTGYRPAALERLVSIEAATARWQALDKFAAEKGHLLVTNGPYRLESWSPQAVVLGVVRDFTYPVGIGTFDPLAYPPRALITSIERTGDQIMVAADAEIAVKHQRDRHIVRKPMTREIMREIYPIRPAARYVIFGGDGSLATAGNAEWAADGRFAATLPPGLSPNSYKLFTAIFLDGNTIDPSIASIAFDVK